MPEPPPSGADHRCRRDDPRRTVPSRAPSRQAFDSLSRHTNPISIVAVGLVQQLQASHNRDRVRQDMVKTVCSQQAGVAS
jgi:hypothetical protein